MSVTKKDIAAAVAEEAGVSQLMATTIINKAFEQIAAVLQNSEEDVRIAGFGHFTVKETKARQSRNPRTGEPVAVPAGRKVAFKPASELKKAVK